MMLLQRLRVLLPDAHRRQLFGKGTRPDRQISCHDSPSSKYLNVVLTEAKGRNVPQATRETEFSLGLPSRVNTQLSALIIHARINTHTRRKTSFQLLVGLPG